MKNLIANVTVNGVENQVEIQPIIIKKANTITLIYNCITLTDFQQVLHMSTNRLLKDLAVDDISQINADFINTFAIIGNGDILQIWENIICDNIIHINKNIDESFISYAQNSYKFVLKLNLLNL